MNISLEEVSKPSWFKGISNLELVTWKLTAWASKGWGAVNMERRLGGAVLFSKS